MAATAVVDVAPPQAAEPVAIASSTSGDIAALDSKEFAVTHPLQNAWVLWWDPPNERTDWLKGVLRVSEFSTVEAFWGTFNNVTEIPAVENAAGGGFFLFKSGLKPAVEDEGNQNGRRYRIEFPSDTPIDKIAQHWEDLLLAAVGEQLSEDPNEVCGVVCNIRKKQRKHRIEVWTRSRDEMHHRIIRTTLSSFQPAGFKGKDWITFQESELKHHHGGHQQRGQRY